MATWQNGGGNVSASPTTVYAPLTTAEAYPRFAESQALRAELDPARAFGNAYLEQVLGS